MIACTSIARLRMRGFGIVLLTLASVAIAVPSATHAQQKKQQKQKAPAAPALPDELSPASMKMAQEILQIKNTVVLFAPLIPTVIDRVKIMHLQTNPQLANDLNEVALSLRKVYASRTEELMMEIAWLYASRFSEAELKEILTFYRSPTGRKVVEFEPQVFDEAMTNLREWQDKFAEEVIARFRVEMKQRGHDL